ncbi:TonB family protein [Inhella inkyongensis]|uniref:TonB family protein n=1 Tax=Inhella inkyongensis TaxID=392593 RepID=A0A840S2X8_9BURK|nr:energy transducer TonB [Inhella inkyongensis]MBB5203194.1 TonB family protein [Inhella inkyongensis]
MFGRSVVCVGLMVAMGGAWAQADAGGISDAERAKRDAQKVFSFIKFSTVKPAKDKDAKDSKDSKEAAAKPAPAKAPATPARPVERPAAVAAAPASPAAAVTETAVPLDTTQTAAQPVQAVTLPAQVEPQPPVAAVPAAPVVEEPDEVELKLVHYVAPDMNRQVIEAMADRPQVIPVRFVVGTDGKVIKAEPKAGANRRLGQAAARAISQWRFEPLPAERTVDVELSFKPE